MNEYIAKLKESSSFQSKMMLHFDKGFSTEITSSLTYLTDSDDERDNVYVDVKNTELFWDGWDEEYKVVSVAWKKFVYNKLVKEDSFLAVYDGTNYYTIPLELQEYLL